MNKSYNVTYAIDKRETLYRKNRYRKWYQIWKPRKVEYKRLKKDSSD